MSESFPKLISFGGREQVDLSNFATKTDFKNVTWADTLKFAENGCFS